MFRLYGAGVRLDLDERWLVFSWGRREDRAVNGGGQLAVPPECCVSIAGRPAGLDGTGLDGTGPDGSLCLAFRFRLPAGASGGGDVVGAEIVVGANRAEQAWQFARWFAREYGVEDLSASWWDAGPSDAERDGSRDWLSAPVSPTTRLLFRSVLTRLTVADS
ncbi:hypothetical protein ACM01_13000 [Streptomyces viridochromogenes]|uniref:Uncharacterized protein n=1 Tax=Streptomyces viridochromogenes TaxID=1938 RepID=A0A0J7ZI59_STRVR|nr:hypothetical protein [Streptomyces viridochromogenes]KMS74833.1 hypothetical protein ACM01_13000 [Streptomyces viridochromogenes]KOG14892.1 hypothetical protein ADK36_30550 [Streptomyces viridochromogenes]KOG15086.1 hypothetical protein ADK35_30195 [Streptomyces viridochromogenes]